MKQGSKAELPLWLAEMLAVSNPSGNSSLATLDLPPALSQRVMNALKADPKTVDLRAQAQHFYNIGARMLELFEEEEMVDILTDVSAAIHRLPTTEHIF
jgi:GINS complex subunit 3